MGSLVDVFTVDVGRGQGGRIVGICSAVRVFLLQSVEFEAGLEFAEEAHDERGGGWEQQSASVRRVEPRLIYGVCAGALEVLCPSVVTVMRD